MPEEQDIQTQLGDLFPVIKDKIRIQRARRIWAEAPADKFLDVFDAAVSKMGFNILVTITGLDNGATLGAIYHLARPSGVMLNVQVNVPKEKPVLGTVTSWFPAADAYERELIDLLGMQVQGLPPGNRYPLPDDWPAGQFPLRKDWNASMLEGVKPPGEMKHV
jgi:membrane-bound hydrogenase subunit beta